MKKFDSINVIPFVDIMLVLLAIVLTSATFVSTGQLDIALPTAASADALDHPDPRQIAVTEQGYFLDGEAIEQAPLLGVIRRLPIDTPVRLQIDASVRFQRFITLVDVINASGLNRVAVETQVLP